MKADELGAPKHLREADEQERAVAEAMQRIRQGLDALAKLRREQRCLFHAGCAVLPLDALPDLSKAARGGEIKMCARVLVSRANGREMPAECRDT